MCGRFVSSSPPDELAKYFDVEAVAEAVLEPSFNVAPSQDVYVVVETGAAPSRHVSLGPRAVLGQGSVDRQQDDQRRAESIAEKNAYKHSFKKRRCIIPADGFYEWKKVPGQKAKQPYFIHRVDGEPMAFAGLWEIWRPADDVERTSDPLRSCTIITGEPNEKIAEIHDRMPVMLPPSAWAEWLDPANDDLDSLGKLLVPAPASLLALHPVRRDVNNVRENRPELIEPAPDEPGQEALL